MLLQLLNLDMSSLSWSKRSVFVKGMDATSSCDSKCDLGAIHPRQQFSNSRGYICFLNISLVAVSWNSSCQHVNSMNYRVLSMEDWVGNGLWVGSMMINKMSGHSS